VKKRKLPEVSDLGTAENWKNGRLEFDPRHVNRARTKEFVLLDHYLERHFINATEHKTGHDYRNSCAAAPELQAKISSIYYAFNVGSSEFLRHSIMMSRSLKRMKIQTALAPFTPAQIRILNDVCLYDKHPGKGNVKHLREVLSKLDCSISC
jgi:hypothetical protein